MVPGSQHLTIVVPGIGGSVLRYPARDGRQGVIAWNSGNRALVDLLRHPERLSLGDEPELRPTGLISSRHLLPGWTVIHGYERLVRSLNRRPGRLVDLGDPDHRIPDADVVLFPYDFRRSITESAERLAAEVKRRLTYVAGGGRAPQVVVVAHSMGGLVARYWLGPLGGWSVCRSLITLGTPHRGAPKALQLVVNGARIGRWPLDALTAVLREWTSVSELLPAYPAIWDIRAQKALYPHELPVRTRATARVAYQVHRDIETAWDQVPRSGAQVVPRIGWSHRTLSSATWDGSVLRVDQSAPAWLDVGGWGDDRGDGTVPAFAAMPAEMGGDNPAGMRVKHRHGPLATATFVTRLVRDYERWTPLTAVRGSQSRPVAIGLDLDEAYPSDEPIRILASIEGRDDSTGFAAWISIRRAGEQVPVLETRMEHAANEPTLATVVSALAPGFYDVTVSATHTTDRLRLVTEDSFAVTEW